MFDIGSSELLLIAIVAIVVIGPKDLPRALYKVGQVVGKMRAMSRHFRSGIDAMVREVELEEMEKKWAAENQRIMKQHPTAQEPASSDASAADTNLAMDAHPVLPVASLDNDAAYGDGVVPPTTGASADAASPDTIMPDKDLQSAQAESGKSA